jgi:phosphatidate cytidylyltransferase
VIVLAARIITAVVGIPAILTLASVGGTAFFILVLALSILGLREYHTLTKTRSELRAWSYLAGVFVLLDAHLFGGASTEIGGVVLLALLLVILLVGFPRYSFAEAGTALLGVAYIPFLFSYLIHLRASREGALYTALLFILTWVSDSLAFFIGSRFGRRPLAPRVSPKKTWEGAVAGVAGTVLTMFFVHKWVFLDLLPAVALGATVGIVAEVGDLIESVLKRQAGAKDSGRILPGHGGILDRFDALLLAAPTMYLLLRLRG